MACWEELEWECPALAGFSQVAAFCVRSRPPYQHGAHERLFSLEGTKPEATAVTRRDQAVCSAEQHAELCLLVSQSAGLVPPRRACPQVFNFAHQ